MCPEQLDESYIRSLPVVDAAAVSPNVDDAALNYQVGGSLRLEAPTYIRRQADDDLFESLMAREYCSVFNARQMGKSSLRVRMQQLLMQQGKRCASLDMTSIGSEQVTPVQWYKGMMVDLFTKFDLRSAVDFKQWWQAKDALPIVQRLRLFIEEILLRHLPNDDILIFVDEIDSALALDFSVDDFFALVRFCYNQRAEDPAYRRLTWSLFGVVNPSDLIRDHRRTPFNVGRAIELKGLAFEDAQPLAAGLVGLGMDERELLREILVWTNGQPFLTQKLCWLTQKYLMDQVARARGRSCEHPAVSSDPGRSSAAAVVERVVYTQVIDHWESQDDPEHLRTIRDRFLRNELHSPRLLGIYETVLTSPLSVCEVPITTNRQEAAAQPDSVRSIVYDDSPEHFELLLSGLLGLYQGRLLVKNRIYATVFDRSWVSAQLANLRPYAKQLDAWINSGREDESRLLRGKALKDAQSWSQERSVGEVDHDFLMASEQYDRKIAQNLLRAARLKEIEKRLEIVRQSRRSQRLFIAALSGALMVATTLGLFARGQYWRSRRSQLKAMITTAEALYSSDQRLDALLQSVRSERELEALGNQLTVELGDRLDTMLRTSAVHVIERNRLTLTQPTTFWTVDISADNEHIATGTADGQIQIWHPDGRLLHDIPGHDNRVRSVRFFPRGDRLVSASSDRELKLWTLEGDLIETLRGHTDAVHDVAIAPDGETIVSVSGDRTVKLWREDGQLIKTLLGHTASVLAVAISPDGQTIASAGEDNAIKLWTREGRLIKTLEGHTGAVLDIAFSPDGTLLASASRDATVIYWDVEQGIRKKTLQGHDGDVLTLDFSPDGKQLVSGSRDSTLKLWNLQGELIDTLSGHQSRVWSVRFAPDSEQIVSASADKTIRLWDLTNPLQTRFLGPSAGIIGIDVNSDASIIAAASDDKDLYFWNRQTGRQLSRFRHPDAVLSVAFSPDDQLIATGSWDGSARLWDLTGTQQAVLNGHSSAVWGITFSPDGQTIATAGADNKVRLWDRQGNLKTVFSGHSSEVRSVAFSPNGQSILSASLDETVKLWSLNGRILNVFTGIEGGAIDANISPDGQLVAAAGFDNTVRLWSFETGELIATLAGHEAEVRSVSFDASGTQLVTAGGDGQVKIWAVPSGEPITTLAGEGEAMWQAIFVEPANAVVAAGENKQVILWDLRRVLSREDLLATSCQWLANYLETGLETSEDRDLCEDL